MIFVQWLLVGAVLLFGAAKQVGYHVSLMRGAELYGRDVRAWQFKIRRFEVLSWNLSLAAAVCASFALSVFIWLM